MHPDLRQALAIAHIEDLQREAAQRQNIRLPRRVAEATHVGDPSIDGHDHPLGTLGAAAHAPSCELTRSSPYSDGYARDAR